MQTIKLQEWKERNKNYFSKGLSSTYRVKEKIKYRDFKFNEYLKIEEGIILEYSEKNISIGETEYSPQQSHLIGYHYICLIDISTNKDIFWMQGNIKPNSNYAVFKANNKSFDVFKDWSKKGIALKSFLNELNKQYKLRLEV